MATDDLVNYGQQDDDQPPAEQDQPVAQQIPGPADPVFGDPRRYATQQKMDAVASLSRSYGLEGPHVTPAARQRVYRQRLVQQELALREREILDSIQQQYGMDPEEMEEGQLEAIVSVIGTPGLSLDETFHAVTEAQRRAHDEELVAEYNAGGILYQHERNQGEGFTGVFGGFKDQLLESFNRGSRQRRMWNSWDEETRRRLVQEYGIKAPTIGRGLAFDEESTGIYGALEAGLTDIAYGLASPIKTLIAGFDGAWRAGNRLYRGQVIMDRSGDTTLPVNTTQESAVESTFSNVLDAISGAEEDERGQAGQIAEVLGEVGKWFQSLLTPGWSRRWQTGGDDGEATFLPAADRQVRSRYDIDSQTMEIVRGIAARMDSSVFGSPMHRLKEGSGTIARFGRTIQAYAGVEDPEVTDAEERDALAVDRQFQQAMDDFLLEAIPGEGQEAVQARAGMRTLLQNSQTIRLASAELAMNGKVDFGRMTAMQMGHRPGTPEFQRTSGLFSVVNNLFMDPTIVGAKAGAAGRLVRSVSKSDAIRNVEKIQEVFDGVTRIPGTTRTVTVPMVGNGFRRAVDDVAVGVTDGINLRLNRGMISDAGDLERAARENDVVAEFTGLNRGHDRVARRQPRFEPSYQRIEDYAWQRVREVTSEYGREAVTEVDEATGVERLRKGVDGVTTKDGELDPQLVVDWMKTEDGLNALVNGRLGGLVSKAPTLPSDSLIGLALKGPKRAASLTLDRINDVTPNVARRMADRGLFDHHGADVVKDVVVRLRQADELDVDYADDLLRRIDETPKDGQLGLDLRAELGRAIESKRQKIMQTADREVRVSQLEDWADLEVIGRKLESDRPFREIGLNSTGLLGQPSLGQMLHGIKVMRSGNLDAAKRALATPFAVAWAPVQFVNGLARSFTILAPSSALRFADDAAAATMRNYASLMPSDMRARMGNLYASGINETQQINIARSIVLETADAMGMPYTRVGRKWMAENIRFLDAANVQRYSPSAATNFVEMGNGQRVAAALGDTQLAGAMALPNFGKMQNVASRMGWYDYLNPLNYPSFLLGNSVIDRFMGFVWSPSVLFRLGFGIRTSADELMAAVARDGAWNVLKARVAKSSLSDDQVIPYMARLDRFLLRTAMRGVTWTPGPRSIKVGGVAMETRMARALDLPDEVVDTLRRAHDLGHTEGLAGARRAVTAALGDANPYDLVSQVIMDKSARYLDWVSELPFIKQADSADRAQALFAQMSVAARNNRRDFFDWGPRKVREMFRQAQKAVSSTEMYRNSRFMQVHRDDVSPHVRSPDELLAAPRRESFHNQHAYVYDEGPGLTRRGRRPDPDSRFHDLLVTEYENVTNSGTPTPEFVDAVIDTMQSDLDMNTSRLALQIITDPQLNLGRRFEQGRMTYGEFHEELVGVFKERMQADPEMMEMFRNRMVRGGTTRDGRQVLGATQEEYEELTGLANSVAADVEWRRQYAENSSRARPGDPATLTSADDVAEVAELRDTLRRLADDLEGWTVEFVDEADIVGGGLASSSPSRQRILINEAAIREDYRNGLQHLRGGEEGTAAAQKREVFERMGIDPDEMYRWLEANGGEETYVQFVVWHEKSHAVLGHQRTSDDLLQLDAITREVEANEFAFAAMGAPFGSRDAVYDLLASRVNQVADVTPEQVVAQLDQHLGGIASAIGSRDTVELSDTLTAVADQLADVRGRSYGMVDQATVARTRTDEVNEVLGELGLDEDNVVALLDQMTKDGLYNALRLDPADPLTTHAERVVESIGEFRRANPTGPDLPLTDEVLDAVADYARHLSTKLSAVDDVDEIEDVTGLLHRLEDETIRDVMRQLDEDGIAGLDADVLDGMLELAGDSVDGPGGVARLRQQLGERLDGPDVPEGAVPAIRRSGTQQDMLRLAQEANTGRVVPPSVVLDDFAETIAEHIGETWLSSTTAVANDLARGDYTPAPGARLWLVERSEDGVVTGLTPATRESMEKSSLATEFVEAPEDIDEAMTLVREGRSVPFLRPVTEFEQNRVAEQVERVIREIRNSIGDEAVDPQFTEFAELAPVTFEEFLQYVATTHRRNGGEFDQFTLNVIEELRNHPDREVKQVADAAERLIRGFGRDAQAQRRLVMTTDKMTEMLGRWERGEEILTQDEAAALALRPPSALPERTYRAKEQRIHRGDPRYGLIFQDATEKGFSALLPLIDYFTRDPLLLSYYTEGKRAAYDIVFANRPRMRRLFETIQSSEDTMGAVGGVGRTQASRNGYVSAKEVLDDLPELLRYAEDGKPTFGVSGVDPVLREMVGEARLSPSVMETETGRWFFDELLPRMVDEVEPQMVDVIEDGEVVGQAPEALQTYLERTLGAVVETEQQLNDAALTRAMTQMLNYTDNDSVASLFSSKYRNLFPFYWAEERFIKRVVQSAAYNPVGFQRGLLTFRGLTTSTILDEDERGNKIFAYPGSHASQQVLLGLIERISGNKTDFRVPSDMSRVTGRWDYVIPGGVDVGVPKNPMPLIGMTGRGVMSWFPESEGIARMVIGEYASNENRDPWELILPPTVLRAMRTMQPDEIRTLYADKMFSALAYMHNNDMVPPPEASDEEWDDFHLSLYNWTQVLAAQSLVYGFGGVTTPDIEVAKGSPQYEFREYVSNYGFEAGIEQFMADYPETTLFSLFETETAGGAPIPATEQVYQFLTTHEDIAENYQEAIGYLIPSQDYTSEFFGPAFAIQKRLGIRRRRHEGDERAYIENVSRDFAFQAAASEYFEMQQYAEEQIEQARKLDDGGVRRRALENEWGQRKEDFLNRHRMFKRELFSIDEGVQRRIDVLDQIRQLNKAALEGDERVLAMLEDNERMELTLEMVEAFDAYRTNTVNIGGYITTKRGGIAYDVTRQGFVEYGQSLVEEHPNELRSLWHRVILPEVPGVDEEEAMRILTGRLES